MSRPYSPLSLAVLAFLNGSQPLMFHEIYKAYGKAKNRKSLYDTVFRLTKQGLIACHKERYSLTPDAVRLIHNFFPKKDGIWKIIIFDIPEPKRKIRNFLRARLKELKFKRWQNSIWISPYQLSPQIETEFRQLAERYFIRLIKTRDINYTEDVQKLFSE